MSEGWHADSAVGRAEQGIISLARPVVSQILNKISLLLLSCLLRLRSVRDPNVPSHVCLSTSAIKFFSSHLHACGLLAHVRPRIS